LNLTIQVPPQIGHVPKTLKNTPNRALDDSEGGRRDSEKLNFNEIKGSKVREE